MKLATLQEDKTYILDGVIVSLSYVMSLPYRIHLPNGNIEIYSSIDEMPPIFHGFDIEGYKQQVNDAHNALFRSMYLSKDYLSIGEIPMWFGDPEFGSEATALSNWWIETCKIVSEYLDGISTDEPIQSPQSFIDSLPTL